MERHSLCTGSVSVHISTSRLLTTETLFNCDYKCLSESGVHETVCDRIAAGRDVTQYKYHGPSFRAHTFHNTFLMEASPSLKGIKRRPANEKFYN